ncbi:MAG TPA: CHASE2 domain-containing protein [Tepidisphaeraceae bacterium]|nr:CHASE2 domain-containing protein [Tepidisphaeraceae bacterium]
MLRHERRLLIDCLGIGLALAALVVGLDAGGVLGPLENWLYDARVRTCQFFARPPTDQLVHLDIDDRALEVIGPAPWPRATWARLLDEVRLAGPRAVEMDVLFSETQPVQWREGADGKFEKIDNDAELAAAIGRLGNVILPASLASEPPPSPALAGMIELLRGDPELTEAELLDRLRARGISADARAVGDAFIPARREAVYRRVADEIRAGVADPAEMRRRILRKTDPELNSPLGRLIAERFERLQTVTEFSRFAYPLPHADAATQQVTAAVPRLVPLRRLSEGASGGAFVDYPVLGSSVVRSVPALLRDGDRAYAQMGVRLACQMLKADLSRARITRNALRVPRDGGAGDVVIPLGPPRQTTAGVRVGMLMDVPWLGSHRWETMYDRDRDRDRDRDGGGDGDGGGGDGVSDARRPRAHVAMNSVWEASQTQEKISRNVAQADDALRLMYEVIAPDKLAAFQPPAPADMAARSPLIDQVLKDGQEMMALVQGLKAEDLDDRSRRFLAAAAALPRLREQTLLLGEDLKRQRDALSRALKDKAVLVGWVASAAVADFVPTPLHDKCPGVVVHGAIFNGIMTGETWRRLPWWAGAWVAVALGLLTALSVARLSPLPALLVALLTACGFAALNGVVLFDYFNRILPCAAPLVTVGAVWSGCTLTRVIGEAAERRRITRRFRSYVDPKLVNYVIENPNVRFDGERREMTVVFTDLVGFTAISEQLGEKVVPMLNELFGELVPVIRHHEGTLNKFLGDGIMFFFNAPRQMSSHAAVAVRAVLEMHEKVAGFNGRLREQGLPELSMRAGVMTAEMIVGDAGGAGAADYTVLGDAVNTGARLEAANKATGTRTLISARTADMLGGEFLVRPVGKLKVVGKDEAVMVYEPLAPTAAADEAMRERARLTEAMVNAFARGCWEQCLSCAAELEAACGAEKLAGVYRALCERFLREPPPEGFDGRIVLTEK